MTKDDLHHILASVPNLKRERVSFSTDKIKVDIKLGVLASKQVRRVLFVFLAIEYFAAVGDGEQKYVLWSGFFSL